MTNIAQVHFVIFANQGIFQLICVWDNYWKALHILFYHTFANFLLQSPSLLCECNRMCVISEELIRQSTLSQWKDVSSCFQKKNWKYRFQRGLENRCQILYFATRGETETIVNVFDCNRKSGESEKRMKYSKKDISLPLDHHNGVIHQEATQQG